MPDKDPVVLSRLPVFSRGPAARWPGLEVGGLVKSPATLSLDDLTRLPLRETVQDFRCEEGWVVAGQRWEGVPVAALIELSGVQPGARYVALSAADFTVALTMDEATAPETILALRLNGETLAPEHGGPCRLVVNGAACFYSVKWVDRMTLLAERPEETGKAIALGRINAKVSETPSGEK